MKMFTKHPKKQLSAYCNGELAAEQAQRVREHLVNCGRCRREHDEIELGVNLAQQPPLVSAPEQMWSEIEEMLDQRSRRPGIKPTISRFTFAFSWYRIAAAGAVIVVAVVIGLMLSRPGSIEPVPRPSLEVESVGLVRIDGDQIGNKARLAVGETLETGDFARARVTVTEIGEVELDANSKMRLLRTGQTEHRLALDHGTMKATIKAPPRLFFVDTPAVEAIDLGCEYTLQVDDAGRTLLHVTLGWVALVRGEREVYVPRYAMCQSWPGVGPGTPYFEDASETFVHVLQSFDFQNGGDEALGAILGEARERDTFTLWHLLSTVDGDRRVQVLNKMIQLVGLPSGISREAVLRLDQTTLDAWKDEMTDTVWF
jgi:Putative zinc-finger/FecR protein